MAEPAPKNELRNGLPLCLSGLLELQKPLYLSGKSRHRVLQSAWVRSRIASDLGSPSDEAVLVAFYSEPENRRELWKHWRASSPPAAPASDSRKAERTAAEPPPSLEYCVLDQLDREFLRSQDSDAVVIDWLGKEVDSRLGNWLEADDEERRRTIHLTFVLATLRNDSSVLRDAVDRVQDLAGEFASLLRAPESPLARGAIAVDEGTSAQDRQYDPSTLEEADAAGRDRAEDPNRELRRKLEQARKKLDSGFESVRGLIELIEDDEALEIIGGFATVLEDRLRALQTDLTVRQAELGARRAGDELQRCAQQFLEDLSELPASASMREDIAALVAVWSDLSKLSRRQVSLETARLRAEVPPALETLKQTWEERDAHETKQQALRKQRPASREEQQEIDDRLDDLHARSVAARKRLRAAEDALLEVLAPVVVEPRAPRPATAPEATQPTLDSRFHANRGLFDADDEPARETEDEEPREKAADPGDLPQPAADTTSEPAAPEWTEREQGVRNAVADALADEPPRLAEAFHICRLATDLKIAADQPRAAVVEAALYASHLRQAHGDLAADLRALVERAPSEPDAACTPAQENTEALLRFAGALAPALLAPHTGAAAWLKGLAHEGLPALYDFSQQAADHSWRLQTAQTDLGLLRRARQGMKRADAMSRLRHDLESWLRESEQLSLGYRPANKVWAALVGQGPLVRLLKAIFTQADPAVVRSLLGELEDHDALRKQVDNLARQLLSKRQFIDRKIFEQIRRRMNRPFQLAREYLELAHEAAGRSGYRRRVAEDCLRLIQREAPGLHRELDAVREREPTDTVMIAAARVARRALTRLLDLIERASATADASEPPASLLLASGLFSYPGIGITDTGLIEADADTALSTLVSSPRGDLTAALKERLEADHLDTVQRILDWLSYTETMDHEEVEGWRERLQRRRRERLDDLRTDVRTVRDKLQAAHLDGRLGEDRYLDLEAGLTALDERIRTGTSLRFARTRADLDGIERDLEQATSQRLAQLRAEAQVEVGSADPVRLEEIHRHLDAGDWVAANELIYRSDGPLVTGRTGLDSGEPLASRLEAERRALRAATRDWEQVVEAAGGGQRLDCLAFDELDEELRSPASALLASWSGLRSRAGGKRASVAKALRELFRCLGFPDVRIRLDAKSSQTATDTWKGELLCAPLADRRDCAVAQFGSLAHGRYRLLVCFEQPTATQVLQALQTEFAGEPAIVVCVAPTGDLLREQLVRTSFERKLPFLLLDRLLLAFLAAQPRAPLGSFFSLSLPFSYCKPFQSRSTSFVPPELFFGREREKRELLDFNGSCFLYGGRQLGKTALLRRVEEEFTSPASGRYAVWIDLKAGGIGDADTADLWDVIWDRLKDLEAIDETVRRPTRNARGIQAFCEALHRQFNGATGRRLLLLLDEADNFLRRDALNSNRATFAESSRLKSLMDRDRSIKVVFAGLHNVLRTTHQSNHPLAHLGTPICIGPFIQPEERRQAAQLLSAPLQACGYRFDPPQLVRSVLARANYYPSLIQIYGDRIMERLSQPGRRGSRIRPPAIDQELIAEVHNDRDFQNEIRSRFDWTLQLDPRYEAIAQVLAQLCRDDDRILRGGMDAVSLHEEVRYWWAAGFGGGFDLEQFKALLEEMVELGVLRRIERSSVSADRFSLRNPNVLALLGSSQDIEDRLVALGSQVTPPELGPREIRRRNGEKGPVHRPLTLQQEHEITGRTRRGTSRNEVVVVCGTHASGAPHVTNFLLAAQAPGDVEQLKTSRSLAAFERNLRSRLNARKPGTTVFLCDASTAAWSEDWLQVAQSSLDKLRSREELARVVFTLDADGLAAHGSGLRRRESGESARTLRFVSLKPWSIDFAAHCLDADQEVGGRLNYQQDHRLAQLAGGWPVLLDLVLDALRRGADPAVLASDAGFDAFLHENASALRRSFALDQVELASTLRLIEDLGVSSEDALLDPETREIADCSLDDEALRLAAWAARKLHLLQAADSAEWRVDPVVAKILETAPD